MVERFLLAGRAIWFYLGKLLWPAKLIFIYPRWQISQAVWWQYLFPAAALLLLAVLWRLRRRWRGPLAGLLFFVGTLFPVLGFFNVYPFIYSFVADHFQYLASLGIITLAAAGVALLLERWRLWYRPAGYVLCLALLATLAGLTWRQSRMYADIESSIGRRSSEIPTAGWPTTTSAWLLADRGQIDEAMAHYRKALEIKPDYAEAHNNLGIALAGRGRIDEAIAHYRKALEIKPNYAEAHNNLGIALAGCGRIDEAIAHYQKALEIKPDYAEAHNNLGVALADRGRIDEAIAHYQKALEIKPDYAEAHNNLGTRFGRPRTDRRGDRPLPEGPGNQARLRRGPLQPRRHSGRPRTDRRGDGALPEGPGNQARLRRGPLQPRRRFGRARTDRRGDSALPEVSGVRQATAQAGPGRRVEGPAAAL